MIFNEKILKRLRDNDPTLTELKLSVHIIDNGDAENLANALKLNTTVKTLRLSGSGVRKVALADVLRKNKTLVKLCLVSNLIDNNSATALSDSLKVNTTLVYLDISVNSISDDGATALSDALKVNTTLMSLNLSNNEICEKGAIALSGALKVNTTLVSLDLFYNKINLVGTLALLDALRVNTILVGLGLGNGVAAFAEDQETNDRINSCLSRNKELKQYPHSFFEKAYFFELFMQGCFNDAAFTPPFPELPAEISLRIFSIAVAREARENHDFIVPKVITDRVADDLIAKSQRLFKVRKVVPRKQSDQPNEQNNVAKCLSCVLL